LLPADEVVPTYTPPNWIVTDGNKSQGYEFGSNRSNRNYITGPEETTLNGVSLGKKRLYDRDRVHETTQVLSGVRSITASSVGPGIFVSGRSSREPANIFDSNLESFWAPNRVAAGTANDWGTADNWIDIRFDGTRDISTVAIALLLGGYRVEDVPVRLITVTDNGSLTTELPPVPTFQQLPVVPGPTGHLRIRIAHESYTAGADVIGIRELIVPGAPIESRLVLPSDLVDQFAQPGATTPAWVMSRDHNDGRETDGTIRREFTVPKDATTSVIVYGALANQSDAVRVVDNTPTMDIGASSTLFDLPELAPRSLIDGLETTRWLSSRTQTDAVEVATLDLRWNGSRTSSGFTVGLESDLAVPESVTVTSGDQVRTAPVGPDGSVSFQPIVGDSLTIVLSYPAIALDVEPLRIGLTSLVVPALVDLYPGPIDRSAPYVAGCGSGPRLRVAATDIDYSVEATLGEVLDRSRLRLIPCGGSELVLARGPVMVETTLGTLPFAIDHVVIGAPPVLSTDVQSGRTLTIDSWESARRSVTIAPGDTDLLVVNEIFNTGWTATLDGQRLSPLEVDGWRQAFIVPAGDGGQVHLSFAPERTYKWATIVALFVLLGLSLLAVIRGSRRSDLAPLHEGTWPTPLVCVFGVTAAIWTTGIGIVLLPVVWFATKDRRQFLAPTALIGFGVAGATYLATKSFVDTTWFGAKGWTISIFAVIALLSVIVGFIATGDDTHEEAASDER
jgi:arabinofuranan 3-O-arabinosyltransferase